MRTTEINKGKDKDYRKEEEKEQEGEERGRESKSAYVEGAEIERRRKNKQSLYLLGWRFPELLSINTLQNPGGEIQGREQKGRN